MSSRGTKRSSSTHTGGGGKRGRGRSRLVTSTTYQPPLDNEVSPSGSRSISLPPKVNFKTSLMTVDSSGNISTRTKYVAANASPRKSQKRAASPEWNTSPPLPPESDTFDGEDPAYETYLNETKVAPKRRRNRGPGDLATWEPYRDEFLAELLRHEGRAGFTGHLCPQCNTGSAKYRCRDCFGGELYCVDCTLEYHKRNPLHRIDEWMGVYFRDSSLKKLGLRIQLGHSLNQKCVNPATCFNDDFTVVGDHGIHQVNLDYCNCETAQPKTTQLLRAGWYPATVKNPKSAATFRILEHFHILSFKSKISAFEFYYGLARETDNSGMHTPKDRYGSFLLMVRQWRHLKMLKRSGQGHDPNGVAATQQGECAVLCPACPQPGMNLPDDWQDCPEDKQWLYALFLAMDANFRLSRHHVSSEQRDPGLSKGWAYFVEQTQYRKHLADHGDIPLERSTCTGHDAVKSANKTLEHLSETGLGTVDCVRHEFKRPNSVGSLQRGERYANMDYLFFSGLRSSEIIRLIVSYDIVCQWYKKLWHRMKVFPHSWHVDHEGHTTVTFLVPKFHLPAHVQACHNDFSFNLTKGVARTDGEGVERGWSKADPLAMSTRLMGPGSRREVIDDHSGDSNWEKTTGMGVSLLRKVKIAAVQRADHENAHELLTATVPPKDVEEWTEIVESWKNDPVNNENPFHVQVKAPTEAAVRRQLHEDEEAEQADEDTSVIHAGISQVAFITSGLNLEEQQRRLKHDRSKLGPHATDIQFAKIGERSNNMQRKIKTFCKVQESYMQGTLALRDTMFHNDPQRAKPLPEDIPLCLPSAVGHKVACTDKLRNHEWRLQHAQAHDALSTIRHNLRLRSHLYRHKDDFVRGQRANTRSRATIQRIQDRITMAVTKYEIARAALVALSPFVGQSGWERVLQPLDAEKDITSMTQFGYDLNEGKRKLSWIWLVEGAGENADEKVHDVLHIEWCRSRARAMRWWEECELLCEEMCRVLAFLLWQAGWWRKKAHTQSGASQEQMEGYIAYAERQAELRVEMHAFFLHKWRFVDQYLARGVESIEGEEEDCEMDLEEED